MKTLHTILCCALITGCGSLFAQGLEAGEITIGTGIEIGIYQTEVTTNIDTDTTFQDTTGAWFVPIHAEYTINDLFSAGVMIKVGKYFDDEVGTDNNTGVYALTGNIHPLRHHLWDPYARVSLGMSSLKIRDTTGDKTEAKWNGFHYEIGAGLRLLLGEHFALDFHGGFNSYNFKLKSITSETEIFNDLEWDFLSTGGEFGVGVAVRF